MNTIQYTLRKVPSSLDYALRKKAKQSGKSLNGLLIDILSSSVLQESGGVVTKRDLSWMMEGDDYEDFNTLLADSRRLNLKDWQ